MNKKLLTIIGLIALLFAACNPNKEVYEQIDKAQKPFSDAFTYTLTDADYTTIKDLALKKAQTHEDSSLANSIASLKLFNNKLNPSKYIPDFLATTFIALDSGSAVKVGYKYSYEFTFDNSQKFQPSATYDKDHYIRDSVAKYYPDAEKGDFVLATFNYNDGTTTTQIDSLVYFDGTQWSDKDDFYKLVNADYESMGAGPGHYHNLSSSYDPNFYIPIFLEQKFPYVKAGDTKEVVFNYFNGSTTVQNYNIYTFDGTKWNGIQNKVSQFIQIGKEWIFDPTVHYTMTKDDYQILVDWVKNQDSISAYFDTQYKNTEYYFGASAYYANFDMRLSKRRDNDPNGYLTGLDDDQVIEVLLNRLKTGVQIFLEAKFPNSEPFVNGVPVYYEITFDTYFPPHKHYMIRYLCTAPGQFEYVEGPTQVD